MNLALNSLKLFPFIICIDQVVLNVGSEDIPENDTAELRMALTQMKNRKTPQEKTTLQQKW